MNVPLSRFLTRFPAAGEVAFAAMAPDQAELRMSVACHEAALETVRSETSALYEARIAALEAEHSAASGAAVAAAREAWCAEEGAAVAARLEIAFEALAAGLADQLADALHPLLAEAVVARARDALIETLDIALADPRRPALILRGPSDLLAAVRTARPDARGVDYIASAGPEATLSAEGLDIVTKLAEALAALRPTEI